MTTPPPADEFGEPLPKPQKASGKMIVVVINLVILGIYTVACSSSGGDAFILDAMIIAVHFIAALLAAAIDRKRWGVWLLSALMILVLGFSTCAMGAKLVTR